jgi:hypothetical protein
MCSAIQSDTSYLTNAPDVHYYLSVNISACGVCSDSYGVRAMTYCISHVVRCSAVGDALVQCERTG